MLVSSSLFDPSYGGPVLACLFLLCLIYGTRKTRVYPPGPPMRPVIGNILDLMVDTQTAWFKYTQYKAVYGDLVSFRGLGNNVLVLNSLKAMTDLLDKRQAIYSDRPTLVVLGELMGVARGMPLIQNGPELRAHRRHAQSVLNPGTVKRYNGVLEDISALLAKSFIEAPADFCDHLRVAASRLILSITYGLSVTEADNEYIAEAEAAMHLVGLSIIPGAHLADFLPWMKHLPAWVPFRRTAAAGRKVLERFVQRPYEHVKREMRKGTAAPSLTHDLLLTHGLETISPEVEVEIQWTTGAMYGAAGETSYATVLTCILAMALHPDKLRLVQEELDRVLGADTMPKVADRTRLPYLEAVIKETMRWHPAAPLAVSHCTSQDDVYEGYFIPKGTVVTPNVWSIAFEQVGPYNVHDFVPERYLVADESQRPVNPEVWAFGFGRRICPGRYLAADSAFIMIAMILWTFDVSAPAGVTIKPKFTGGLVSYPEPFECHIVPRSAAREQQVRWRAAQTTI